MALRLSRLFGRGGGDQVVMKDGANNVTLENVVAPAEPDAMQDVFVTEFTGSDEEVGALLAALQQRGLIDTSTGEIVWADEAVSNLSENAPVLDWLNANHFERGPNGIMVWNGEPVSHGILPFIEQQNVTGPGGMNEDGDASGLVSEVGFPPLDGNSAAREAGSGMATGVHDIHMNQGDTQSLKEQMQSENRQFRESARTQPPDAPEADGVMQHNQTDLEFVRARPGVTANEYGDSGPLEIKFEDVETPRDIIVKWEGPDFDASKNEVAIESLEVAHEGVRGANQQGVVEDLNVKYTLLDGEDDVILNIKTDSEVTDYAEGDTSFDDFNPKEAGNAYNLPEVNDEVLVQFQAREPGRMEFPNLATSDTMPMEEVHFARGTGRPGHLDDDGPSTLLGDADGDGRVDTTDAMSLNFEEIKIAAIHDGLIDESESDALAADFDGIEIPD